MKKILVCFVLLFAFFLSPVSKIYAEEVVEDEIIDVQEDETLDIGELLTQVITPELIVSITSVLGTIAALLKICASNIKLKHQKSKSNEDVCNDVTNVINSNLESAIKNIIQPIAKKVDSIQPTLQSFAKVLALSQENSTTSRLAILDLIQNMKVIDDEIVEKARESILQEEQKKEQKKEQKIEKLEKISKPVE